MKGKCICALLAVFHLAGDASADFNYPDFLSVNGLNLQVNAAQFGNRLRLTPSLGGQHGSAWRIDQQEVGAGFTTTFNFQITNRQAGGGDGFAFVVQNESATSLGPGGSSIGYAGITNSIAVEFDTWGNIIPAEGIFDPNNNHISVQTRGLLANSSSHVFSLGTYSAFPFELADGNIHTVLITYTPGSMSVFVDDLINPRLQVAVNLSSQLNLNAGDAWVGFTSSTGFGFQNHDILNWSFASVPEPGTVALTATALMAAWVAKKLRCHRRKLTTN